MRKSKNKIVLEYIENTVKNNPFLSSNIYRWMTKEGTSLFNLKSVEDDLYKKGKIQKKVAPERKVPAWMEEAIEKPAEYDIPPELYRDIILTVCSRDKRITKADFDFERKLNWLKQIVHLNKVEFAVVRFYAYLKRSNILGIFISSNFTYSRGGHGRFSLYDFPEIVNMDEKMIQKALNQAGRLHKSGLLVEEFKGEITLNEAIYDFLKMTLKSKEELKQLMIGTLSPGEIPLSEYSFLEQIPGYLKTLLHNALKRKQKGVHLLFYGVPGTGKTEFAKSLASSVNKNLYSICDGKNKIREPKRSERLFFLKLSDYILGNTQALLLLDEAEDIFRNPVIGTEPGSKVFMNRFLEENTHPVLWTTNNIHSIDPSFLRRFTYIVEFKKPNVFIRQKIWEKALQENNLSLPQNEVLSLAQNYDIPPAMIQSVIKSTSLAEGDMMDIKNTLSIFEKVLGQRYQKTYKGSAAFNSELLNTDTDMENLSNRLSQLKSKSFSLCLYGAPGTGKSAYARYIAEKLNLDVIEKKASDLLGKYVGETEKNIADAFEEAKQKKALLIFDEADSLLRDRNIAQHSWEISQVNEMLTWMEQYPYPFVCTTNLMNNLDKASLRRFTFKVKYNYLKKEQVKLAFEYFFGQKSLEEKIDHLTCLSPGDFIVVKKKAEILGYLGNKQELITMLEKEMEVKNEKTYTRKIGFV